jgi:hypothetical protein
VASQNNFKFLFHQIKILAKVTNHSFSIIALINCSIVVAGVKAIQSVASTFSKNGDFLKLLCFQ